MKRAITPYSDEEKNTMLKKRRIISQMPYLMNTTERDKYVLNVEQNNENLRIHFRRMEAFCIIEQEQREKELQKQEFMKLEEKINSLRQVLDLHTHIVESTKDKGFISIESDESTETIEEKESDESTETIGEGSTSSESNESTDSDDEMIISVKKKVLKKLDKNEYNILGSQKKQNENTPFLLMSQTSEGFLRTKMINEFHPLFEKVINAIKTKRFPNIETEVQLWGLLRGECNDCNCRLDECICDLHWSSYKASGVEIIDQSDIRQMKREQNLCQFLDINPNDFRPYLFINFTIGEEKIGLDEEYHDNDEVKNILLKKGIFFLEEYDCTKDDESS